MSPRHPQIAADIRSARLRKGLSQEKAAELVGTSRFHWIRWEQGLHKPDDYAARLIEVLGLPEDVFGDPADDLDDEDLVAPLTRAISDLVERRVARLLASRKEP